MDRRLVMLGLAATPLAACETLDPGVLDGIIGGQNGGLGLTAADVALGLKAALDNGVGNALSNVCLLYTSPSPRDQRGSRMPSSA